MRIENKRRERERLGKEIIYGSGKKKEEMQKPFHRLMKKHKKKRNKGRGEREREIKKKN